MDRWTLGVGRENMLVLILGGTLDLNAFSCYFIRIFMHIHSAYYVLLWFLAK
jgi:MFS-type transporter involved in bile tolerance (Atg22 family)